jgi:hypothetical protein
MSEFGAARRNCGGAQLEDGDRLDPALRSFRDQFPVARVKLYTDFDYEMEGITTIRVTPPFDSAHPRYGWRSHDYYQAYGLLHSSADVAVAMDSDMLIVSDRFRAILPLAEKFGFVAPANTRLQVSVEATIGEDSNYDLERDPTGGTGFSYNLTPLAFSTAHEDARRFLQVYCSLMQERPGRAGLRLWQAAYSTGFNPYLLPYQWCVCTPKDLESKHIWGNEIVLHVGHPDVYPHYLKTRRRRARWAVLKRLRNLV